MAGPVIAVLIEFTAKALVPQVTATPLVDLRFFGVKVALGQH